MNVNLDWMLSPLTGYAITGMGLLALLWLWLSAKIETRKCRHEMSKMKDSTDTALRQLAEKVEEIATRPAPEPVQDHAVPAQSMNLTRRARALHMRRKGSAPNTIAAALGVSHEEVALLFKLDQIFQQTQES